VRSTKVKFPREPGGVHGKTSGEAPFQGEDGGNDAGDVSEQAHADGFSEAAVKLMLNGKKHQNKSVL